MSNVFKKQLKHLGEGIGELRAQAVHLENMFKICVEEYRMGYIYNYEGESMDSIGGGIQEEYPKATNPPTYKEQISSEAHWDEGESLAERPFQMMEDLGNIINLQKVRNYSACGTAFLKRPIPDGDDSQPIEENNCVSRLLPDPSAYSTGGLNTSAIAHNYPSLSKPSSLQQGKLIKRRKKPSKTPKKQVFASFSKEEKERILYDKLEFGLNTCERKWGINHSAFSAYCKSVCLFSTENGKNVWMKKEKERIQQKFETLDEAIVNDNILNALLKKPELGGETLTIHEFCNLCFNSGIAVVASKYELNLFELEFMLQRLCPKLWKQYERCKWYLYCLPFKSVNNVSN